MKRIILTFLMVLLPVYAGADYRVFLKNGAVVKDIKTYIKQDGEIIVFFKSGSMNISQDDILKIEGSESIYEDVETVEMEGAQENTEQKIQPAGDQVPSREPSDEKTQKMNQLKAALDTVISDIRETEKQEAQLVTQINQKAGETKYYNIIQLRQQEKELEPIKQELAAIQEKKKGLVQKKIQLEDEFRSLQ